MWWLPSPVMQAQGRAACFDRLRDPAGMLCKLTFALRHGHSHCLKVRRSGADAVDNRAVMRENVGDIAVGGTVAARCRDVFPAGALLLQTPKHTVHFHFASPPPSACLNDASRSFGRCSASQRSSVSHSA